MQIYSKSVRNLLKAKKYIETERERKGEREREIELYCFTKKQKKVKK